MAEAKLRKAIINSRYPTARDLATFLRVPEAYVKRLATELMDAQQNGGREHRASNLVNGTAARATRKGRTLTKKKRTGRAR